MLRRSLRVSAPIKIARSIFKSSAHWLADICRNTLAGKREGEAEGEGDIREGETEGEGWVRGGKGRLVVAEGLSGAPSARGQRRVHLCR